MYGKSTLTACLHKDLRSSILWRLGDTLIHSAEQDDHLKAIRRSFDLRAAHNFKLHTEKWSPFSISAHWCGRIIAEDRIRIDPERVDGIRNMRSFTTGAAYSSLYVP